MSTFLNIKNIYNTPLKSLEHTLGANNITRANLTSNPPGASNPHCNSQSLEGGLSSVVIVISIGAANVKSHISSLSETLQAVCDHLSTQVANLLALEAEVDHGPRTAGEINNGPGKSLIERRITTTEAGERLAGTEGFGECCAEGEEGIFCGVVVVNCKVLLVDCRITLGTNAFASKSRYFRV